VKDASQKGIMREPLSNTLKQMAETGHDCPCTLNALLAGTGGRGIFLVLVFLSLPFCLPILPGVSTPFGLAIIFLSFRKMFNLPGRLPAIIGDREFERDTFESILNSSVKVLNWFEKVVYPRYGNWLGCGIARILNSVTILVMGILMALPLPVPLTNTIPAWAILIIAVSTAEADGALIWLGYLCALCSVVYFLLIWKLVVEAWNNSMEIWSAVVDGFYLVSNKWTLVMDAYLSLF